MTVSSFSQSINCMMARRPTGMTSRGRKISNSEFIQSEQLRSSSGAGDTIAAARRLAGKTADDSRKIDLRAHCEFIEPAKFLEPAKQGPTSSMRERSFQSRFADSGSLSDHDNVADDGAA